MSFLSSGMQWLVGYLLVRVADRRHPQDDRSTAESARHKRRAEWRELRREQMHLSGVLPLEMPEYEGRLGHAAVDLTGAASPDSPSLQDGGSCGAGRSTAWKGAPQAGKGYLPSSDHVGMESCTTQTGDLDPHRIRSLASSGGGGSRVHLDGAHHDLPVGREGSVLSVVDEGAQVHEGPTASVMEHTGSESADGSLTSGGTGSIGSKEGQRNGTKEGSTSSSREQPRAS